MEVRLDTVLARTFLTVISAGSFIHAADRLHVTQSTVSARIRALEEQLGCQLFIRNKAGTTLTAAGRRFQKHAGILVRTVEYARHDIGVARGFSGSITIGGRFGLWEHLLLHWLPEMRRLAPTISLRAEIAMEAELMQGLVDGRLDIGVMYTPESRPGLKVELLLDERLVLASTTRARKGGPGPGLDYVYVDWGPEFYARHSVSFPDLSPALTVNIGWLALNHILVHGGSAYFPLRLIKPHLVARRLFRISTAPEFVQPAYLVYPDEDRNEDLDIALDAIRHLADRDIAGCPTTSAKRVSRTAISSP
jgi:DNA-binding transcriptional LysR family regulator